MSACYTRDDEQHNSDLPPKSRLEDVSKPIRDDNKAFIDHNLKGILKKPEPAEQISTLQQQLEAQKIQTDLMLESYNAVGQKLEAVNAKNGQLQDKNAMVRSDAEFYYNKALEYFKMLETDLDKSVYLKLESALEKVEILEARLEECTCNPKKNVHLPATIGTPPQDGFVQDSEKIKEVEEYQEWDIQASDTGIEAEENKRKMPETSETYGASPKKKLAEAEARSLDPIGSCFENAGVILTVKKKAVSRLIRDAPLVDEVTPARAGGTTGIARSDWNAANEELKLIPQPFKGPAAQNVLSQDTPFKNISVGQSGYESLLGVLTEVSMENSNESLAADTPSRKGPNRIVHQTVHTTTEKDVSNCMEASQVSEDWALPVDGDFQSFNDDVGLEAEDCTGINEAEDPTTDLNSAGTEDKVLQSNDTSGSLPLSSSIMDFCAFQVKNRHREPLDETGVSPYNDCVYQKIDHVDGTDYCMSGALQDVEDDENTGNDRSGALQDLRIEETRHIDESGYCRSGALQENHNCADLENESEPRMFRVFQDMNKEVADTKDQDHREPGSFQIPNHGKCDNDKLYSDSEMDFTDVGVKKTSLEGMNSSTSVTFSQTVLASNDHQGVLADKEGSISLSTFPSPRFAPSNDSSPSNYLRPDGCTQPVALGVEDARKFAPNMFEEAIQGPDVDSIHQGSPRNTSNKNNRLPPSPPMSKQDMHHCKYALPTADFTFFAAISTVSVASPSIPTVSTTQVSSPSTDLAPINSSSPAPTTPSSSQPLDLTTETSIPTASETHEPAPPDAKAKKKKKRSVKPTKNTTDAAPAPVPSTAPGRSRQEIRAEKRKIAKEERKISKE